MGYKNSSTYKSTILKLVAPVACGGFYGGERIVCVEGLLRGKRFDWRPCDKETLPGAVAIPMERFIFRLVDIPPANRKVLAGQVSKFLPLPAEDIVWQVLPVAGRSFLMALPRQDWQKIREELKAGRRKPPMVIPALVAAALYHYWHHGGSGPLALPAGPGYILMDMADGRIERLDLREGQPEEGVAVYDNQEIIACGAALYNLVPHPFGGDISGRRPFARVLGRAMVATILLCCGAGFLFFATHGRDVARLERVKGALQTIKEDTREVETIMARNKKIETTADFLERVNTGYISPYLVLGDISAHLPPRTFLIDFFIDAGKGYLTGVARDVTAVLEAISGRPYVAVAEFSAPVVRDNQGNERFQLRFELVRKE